MISVVITAAGNSTRFGKNKMLQEIGDKPLILHTITSFLPCSQIDEIIITGRKEDLTIFQDLIEKNINSSIPIKFVEGGKERIISLYNGIEASEGDWIISHDGARPFPPMKLIEDLIDGAQESGAAMTAINPVATVKLEEGDARFIKSTLLRKHTWIAQTPQMFRREIIIYALKKAIDQNYFVPTDDSEIVSEMTGNKVKIIPGDPTNMKVTFPIDLIILNALHNEHRNRENVKDPASTLI